MKQFPDIGRLWKWLWTGTRKWFVITITVLAGIAAIGSLIIQIIERASPPQPVAIADQRLIDLQQTQVWYQEQSLTLQVEVATASALKATPGPTATAVQELKATATAFAVEKLRWDPTATAVAVALAALNQTPQPGAIVELTPVALSPTATSTPQPTFMPQSTSTPSPAPTATPTAVPTVAVAAERAAVALPAITDIVAVSTATAGSQTAPYTRTAWLWEQGTSPDSKALPYPDAGVLEVISGPQTDFWNGRLSAPRLLLPLEGDFELQTVLTFTPGLDWQAAGIAIMDLARPEGRIEVRRSGDGGDRQILTVESTLNNNSNNVATIPYGEDHAYLRIQREGDRWSFSASKNGANWMPLAQDLLFVLPKEVHAAFFAYSTRNAFATATFGNVQLGEPSHDEPELVNGSVPFKSNQPDRLPSTWGWYPGRNAASDLTVTDTTIQLVAGPRTNAWNGDVTAPHVDLPMTGNFSVQARFAFDTKDRWQEAGILIRPQSGPNRSIDLRRSGAGPDEQRILAAATQNNDSNALIVVPYGKNVTYLNIVRRADQWAFRASENGVNWFTLLDEQTFTMPDDVYISFFVVSSSQNGVLADLSEIRIDRTPPEVTVPAYPDGAPLPSPQDERALNPVWGWYPGLRPTSEYFLNAGAFTLVGAPYTDLTHGTITSPWVELPVSGNFTSQVHVRFTPVQRWQVSGYMFYGNNDLSTRVDFRRIGDGGGDQTIDVSAVDNNSTRSLTRIPWAATDYYLRVQRKRQILEFSYSEDGQHWETLLPSYVTTLPPEIKLTPVNDNYMYL